ncbi:MAG: hypothetical protein RLZZ385_2324 [Pseudomonadota bacterium]|jgi:aspartyl/asparaginyl beta-hydroxylase (cupin superfamily)
MTETLDAVLDRAMVAIQNGNARGARQQLEFQISQGNYNSSAFTLLAVACRFLGDNKAMEQSLDDALALDPRNINALIMKGDQLLARNDMAAAGSYFDLVVKLAEQAQAGGSKSADLQNVIDHARKGQARCSEVMSNHLLSHLIAQGYDPQRSPRRFTHALDLLTGKRQVYHQKPRALYFPELPQIQFYEREEFSWVGEIEGSTDDITEELYGVVQDKSAFKPYLTADSRLAGSDPQKVKDNEGWQAFYLWQDGEVVLDNAVRCPRTMAALEKVPLTRIRGRGPSVLFSMLTPGARIAPHTGFVNTRLICHLPLLVPGHCALRVGNETREWERGKLLIFDDTMEHEAWNNSNQSRVVLIFDIWRPELTLEERKLVAAMLEGVDSFSAKPKPWND